MSDGAERTGVARGRDAEPGSSVEDGTVPVLVARARGRRSDFPVLGGQPRVTRVEAIRGPLRRTPAGVESVLTVLCPADWT